MLLWLMNLGFGGSEPVVVAPTNQGIRMRPNTAKRIMKPNPAKREMRAKRG